ncbi:hypothetical protein WOSG25_420020 [Weissella oryzae SG25]|uniref:Uncharacterized protein n=1 Tax=Weissella oryzae (strain DSM 25784 / JCM 18191 / LMG 30913 / SG25) TaxID=1329250 RepID=A0A069CWD4_WEIOS|nr:hypothetical protein [Weissella oryzae]GAK32115.1 hypothetical protein WOSG25_420020 [Weissella oryzae SG25]
MININADQASDSVKELFSLAVATLNEVNNETAVLDAGITNGAIRVSINYFETQERMKMSPNVGQLAERAKLLTIALVRIKLKYGLDQELVNYVNDVLEKVNNID